MTLVRRPFALALLGLSAMLLDCASLDALPVGACGNGVVDDATEDCDGFPDTCGKPADGAKACRLVCDRTKTDACHAGWGCGVDGICRQTTGILDLAGPPLSAGAVSLITGDFDGDGRTDVVAAPPYGSGANARACFFDASAGLATETTLAPLNLPIVRDFDGDGLADVGFALEGLAVGAFGALAGHRDRSFATVLFPALVSPQTAAAPVALSGTDLAFPNGQVASMIAVTQTDAGNRLISIGSDLLLGVERLDVAFPVSPDGLVGVPRAGRVLAPSVLSQCGEVVTAYNVDGRGKVAIFSPCTKMGNDVRWANKATPTEYDVGPEIVAPGLFVGDMTGDGHADVAVATSAGIWTAESNKVGLVPFAHNANLELLPLAVADLDGDGAVDYVLPIGIVLSASAAGDAGVATGPSVVAQPRGNQTNQWAEAVIGRFNNDELPDVVVRYADSLDVELWGNGGDRHFSSFVVPSDHPVRSIVSGDFDGDRVTDIAFLASPRPPTDAAGSGGYELALAYGSAAGAPESPRIVGRFANARALAALRNASAARDDLVVMEQIPAESGLPTTSVTALFGSGERQAIAPLLLRDESALKPLTDGKLSLGGSKVRVWSPTTLAAGFLREPTKTDVFAIAFGLTIDFSKPQGAQLDRSFPTGVWVAPGNTAAAGGFDPFTEVQALTGIVAGVDSSRLDQGAIDISVVSTLGDIDVPRDGLDEVVNVARTPDGTTGVFIVRPATNTTPAANVTLPGVKASGGDPIALVDIDGDDASDLVLLTRSGNARKILVLLNDGNGGFRPTPIEVPIPTTVSTGEEPLSFAHLTTGVRVDGTRRIDLAFVTSQRLFLATFSAATTSFLVTDASNLLGGGAVQLTGIAAGDIDGDGVEDLAIADSGSIRIVRQQPRLR